MPVFWSTASTTNGTASAVPTGVWLNATNTQTAPTASALCNTMVMNTAQTTAAGIGLCLPSSATQYLYYNELDGWNDVVDHQTYLALARGRVTLCREQAEELRRRQEEQRRLQQEAYELRVREQQAAVAKSRELLLRHLTKAQRETFEKNAWFVVIGGKTKTRYRIKTTSYAGNIERLRGADQVDAKICCHCDGIPLYDQHLAQKLLLECDEDGFMRKANVTRLAA